jgi:hypothetical protein
LTATLLALAEVSHPVDEITRMFVLANVRNMPRRLRNGRLGNEGGPVDAEDGSMSGDDVTDWPRAEPEGYSQQEQLKSLREDQHEHVYFDTSEIEEEEVLTNLFGSCDEQGIYHAPEEQEIYPKGGEES